MRRAFTLIELVVIVAIISIMVTVAVMSVNNGQKVARLRGATRDVFATIRQARSIALVTQQPGVITYSTVIKDGETQAEISLKSVRLMNGNTSVIAETLKGDLVNLSDSTGEIAREEVRKKNKKSNDDDEENASKVDQGETIEDILFAPVNKEVLRGMVIKVVVGDGELDVDDDLKKSTLSAFSNADQLLGRYKGANKSESSDEKNDDNNDKSKKDASITDLENEKQEPVTVAWESNGRCDAHKVWVYPSGSDYESGLLIVVDRFGAAKIIMPGEED